MPENGPRTEGALEPVGAQGRFAALSKAYRSRIDAIDKRLGVSASLSKQPRLSTGLLAFDLMLGGSLVPGMSVVFGAEQSAKSTACFTTLRSALRRNIPVRKYFDPEGAVDRRYTGNILGTDSFTAVFGDRDRNGRWITDPLCWYHDANSTEAVLRTMHRTASMMPNKVYHEQVGEWFLVFERDRPSMELMKEMVRSQAVSSPDKTLFKTTGRYWCSVGDDDAPQAVFFLDSLPSLSADNVEEDVKNPGLAAETRVLGPHLKRVRGRLRPKGIIMVCVNQLRDRPMAGPGQLPWYEPMGNVVKYTCLAADTRIITDEGMIRVDDYERRPGARLLTSAGMQTPTNFGYMGYKAIAEVTLSNGQMLRCSHDHGVLALSLARNLSEEFVQARDLTKWYVKTHIGQDAWSRSEVRIVPPDTTSYSMERNGGSTVPSTVTPRLGRWMGLMTGDGSYCSDVCSYTSTPLECEQYADLTEELFGYRPHFAKWERRYGSTVFKNWAVQQTLRMLGMKQSGLKKRVPEAIFRSPREIVIEYLTGLFTADGCFGKTVGLTTISGQLAHDVQLLLNNLGCEAILRKSKHSDGFAKAAGKSRRRWFYGVWLTRVAAESFLQLADVPQHKLANLHPRGSKRLTSKMGFPDVRGELFSARLLDMLYKHDAFRPNRLLARRGLLYRWVDTLRTQQERTSVTSQLDSIYKLVDDYEAGYRWYRVRSLELNHAEEATYDGTTPSHTIVANGIVCHNSDARTMFTSRVPMDGFPRAKNKSLCVEDSVEFPGAVDYYAFKGMTNVKNKYGQPFRKSSGRVWIKDGEGEPRGFDPVYDQFRFLDDIGAIGDFVPTTVVDSRKKFYVNLKPVMNVEWTWPMFKAMVIGQHDRNRRVLKIAQDLGAPVRFDIGAYSRMLLESGRAEDMLAAQAKQVQARAIGVDIEADPDGDDDE